MSETAGHYARRNAEQAGIGRDVIDFVRLDCLNDPLPDGFDVVICSLFLHHFSETAASRIMDKMRGVARRLVLIDDLRRTRTGFALAWLGTRLLSRSAIVHTDGPRSVEAAFTKSELARMAAAAGMPSARITQHWPHRMLLEWMPPSA